MQKAHSSKMPKSSSSKTSKKSGKSSKQKSRLRTAFEGIKKEVVETQEKAVKKLVSDKKTRKKITKRLHKISQRSWQILSWPFRHKFVGYGLLAFLVFSIIGMAYMLRDVPSPRNLTNSERFEVSTQIFDRNGKLLYEIFADENRIPISIDELPPHVLQATIAIEDQRFYRHIGFDIIGISRALVNNISGKPIEGGSTITQQLVKNALLTRERTITRKIKEAMLAVLTEMLYSKKEILEMYLNYISYGGTAVGIESASNYYFDKSARDLTVAEAALLAGLPQAPSRYSPFGSNAEASKARQQDVIDNMVKVGYLSKLEAEEAKGQNLQFALDQTEIEAPHFVFFVRDLLYEQFGEETVKTGGLRVTTTLDLDLQQVAQASVSAEVEKIQRYRVGNGSALIAKPNTGEILAMVGSINYFDTENDGQVNVTLAQRQPGSSIKPLMYATAFQEGVLNPGTVIIDDETCFQVPGQKDYCPKNYDGTYKGPVTVRRALGNSLNIPAVKGLQALGVERFMNQATAMGITSWDDPSRYGLSLTLGGGEVRMIDLAQAFGVLANQGVKVPFTPFLKIEDYSGNVLWQANIDQRKADLEYLTTYDDRFAGELERVMDRGPAYLASHIMQDNNARTEAFGPRSELVIPNQVVSVKTGTTNDLKDNWTVGFTPDFLVTTWVGNNDSTPMNPYVVSGVTGAAPIFNDLMSFILQDREATWQDKPADVTADNVCASGFPPEENASDEDRCDPRQEELFWLGSQPSASKVFEKETWIDVTTGLPPVDGKETDLVLEKHTFYEDPVTDLYCQTCSGNNQPAPEES